MIVAFTLQGSGIGNHLSTINNRLSTNHALRPMAEALRGDPQQAARAVVAPKLSTGTSKITKPLLEKAKKPWRVQVKGRFIKARMKMELYPSHLFRKYWSFILKRPRLFRPLIRYLIRLERKNIIRITPKDEKPPERDLAVELEKLDHAIQERALLPYNLLDAIVKTTLKPITDPRLGHELLTRLDTLLAGKGEDPSVHFGVIAGLGAILATTSSDPVAAEAIQVLNKTYQHSWLSEKDHASILHFLQLLIKSDKHFRVEDFLSRITRLQMPSKIRSLLLGDVIERLFFMRPEAFTAQTVDRLGTFYGDLQAIRYFMFYVATRGDRALPEAREAAQRFIDKRGYFQLHDRVRGLLQDGTKNVLIVHNISDGQGDELMRVHTFASALLDFNPEIQVTLITNRDFLWDHPRLRVLHKVDVTDDEVTKVNYDLVVNHVDRDPKRKQSDLVFQKHFESYLAHHPPGSIHIETGRLFASGEVYFLINTLRVQGVQYTETLSLNRPRLQAMYEPGFRLLAELGIPFTVGEEKPKTLCPIVGIPNFDARAAWDDLMRQKGNLSDEGNTIRPVAVVNPFGGTFDVKGYTLRETNKRLNTKATYAGLVSQIRRLVEKGLYVVILPNGRYWGSATLANIILEELLEGDEALKHIVVAPDPPKMREKRREEGIKRNETSRFLKYWISYADEIYTIEGGLMHLAYALRKPYRMIVVAGSGLSEWHPYGESLNQKVGTSIVRMLGKKEESVSETNNGANSDVITKTSSAGFSSALTLSLLLPLAQAAARGASESDFWEGLGPHFIAGGIMVGVILAVGAYVLYDKSKPTPPKRTPPVSVKRAPTPEEEESAKVRRKAAKIGKMLDAYEPAIDSAIQEMEGRFAASERLERERAQEPKVNLDGMSDAMKEKVERQMQVERQEQSKRSGGSSGHVTMESLLDRGIELTELEKGRSGSDKSKTSSAGILKFSSNRLSGLIKQLNHSELIKREEAAKAIGLLRAEAKAAIPALEEALLDPYRLIINEASSALLKIGPSAYPVLVKALRHGDRVLSLAIAKNLGYSDPPIYSAIPVLNSVSQGASDFDKSVYQSAIERIKSTKTSSAGNADTDKWLEMPGAFLFGGNFLYRAPTANEWTRAMITHDVTPEQIMIQANPNIDIWVDLEHYLKAGAVSLKIAPRREKVASKAIASAA